MQFCLKNPRQKWKKTNYITLEAYSEPRQTFNKERFAKLLTAFSGQLFSQKAPC